MIQYKTTEHILCNFFDQSTAINLLIKHRKGARLHDYAPLALPISTDYFFARGIAVL